ncbi:MAG TPA: ribosome silencing factor [Acidimicrobiales bacterium]|nr:ribosome silencing factor [Acidimicrobiales bacterium]
MPPIPEGDDLSAKTDLTSDERVRVAAEAAASKQGEEIVILSVGEVLAIVDSFVITSADNTRQVATIAEEIEKRIKAEGGGGPFRVEGLDDKRWVLLDYGDVVVHVFLREVREFYDLERLWSDVPRQVWEASA